MKIVFKILIVVLVVIIGFNIIMRIKIKNIDIIGNNNVSDAEIVTLLFDNDIDRSSAILFIKDKFGKKNNMSLVNSYEIEYQPSRLGRFFDGESDGIL